MDIDKLLKFMVDKGASDAFITAGVAPSLKINGKVIQFETREEFETARRAAFGAAANFGAGEISEKQPGPG